MKYLTLLLPLALLFSCGGGDTSAPESPLPLPTATPGQLPSIPLEKIVYLWNNATYMDATFYEIPASINQSEPDQIRASLTYLSEEAAVQKANCKPFGHVWFQVNGKNVEEADVYFQEGCTYYVWYENGKPAYSNELTPEGVSFYNNIIRSVEQNARQ